MGLYAAFDLHSNNSYLGIILENGQRVFTRKLRNDGAIIKLTLRPFKKDIEGIVVESAKWVALVGGSAHGRWLPGSSDEPDKDGVGPIIGSTIMLETGPVSSFPKVGNYVSYCRKVSTGRFSNEKKKGTGNRKNGNAYLACAYSEAAEHARRYDSAARKFFNRKLKNTNAPTAHNALAHKLARAAYSIIRDGVDFMPDKAFA